MKKWAFFAAPVDARAGQSLQLMGGVPTATAVEAS
jgi:hypothetical protein